MAEADVDRAALPFVGLLVAARAPVPSDDEAAVAAEEEEAEEEDVLGTDFDSVKS